MTRQITRTLLNGFTWHGPETEYIHAVRGVRRLRQRERRQRQAEEGKKMAVTDVPPAVRIDEPDTSIEAPPNIEQLKSCSFREALSCKPHKKKLRKPRKEDVLRQHIPTSHVREDRRSPLGYYVAYATLAYYAVVILALCALVVWAFYACD